VKGANRPESYQKRPRRQPGKLWAGSRSLVLNKKLLLQLLHREFGKGSRSFDQKGILILSTFFYRLSVNLPSSMQSASRYPFSLSCKEHSTPESYWKNHPRDAESPRSEDIHILASAARNLASPSVADSRCDAANQSPSPDPTKHQEASPLSPKSFRLEAQGGPQPGEGSSVPRPKKQPQ
jgi:hypothetical protein